MRLFLDTASIEECRAAAKLGVMSGVTTNPSLWAQAGGGNYREIILEIAGIVDGPISAECLSRDAEGLVEEARRIAAWHSNVVVKIPIDEGWRPSPACRKKGSRPILRWSSPPTRPSWPLRPAPPTLAPSWGAWTTSATKAWTW